MRHLYVYITEKQNYTLARRYEFYVLVAVTILQVSAANEWDIFLATQT